MNAILAALAAPFPVDAVQWRIFATNREGNKGQPACYIDARDVQNRLDDVMGVDWADELIVQPTGLVSCKIGLYLDGVWRWRQDATAAVREIEGNLNPKQEQEREKDQKGAASDAFKRAGVKWGVGRYLYNIDAPWVAIDQYRKIDKVEQPKLRAVLERYSKSLMPVMRSAAPPPPSAPEPDEYPPDMGERSDGYEPDTGELSPRETILLVARRDPNWTRILKLLDAAHTVGDVTRALNDPSNLAIIKAWPEPWKAVLRDIRQETLECIAENRARA